MHRHTQLSPRYVEESVTTQVMTPFRTAALEYSVISSSLYYGRAPLVTYLM